MDELKYKNFVHRKLLQILKFVDGICREENIQYSLIGGSLIGAIRHSGFIPWDDDVDIAMTRTDFLRFKSIANKYLEGTEYVYCDYNGRVEGIDFKTPQAFENWEICRMGVDIYILDNLPDDEKEATKLIFELKKIQGMLKKGKINWKRYTFKGKLMVFGSRILGMFQSEKKLLAKYFELSNKYNFCNTKRYFLSNDVYVGFSIPIEKEFTNEVIEHKFETENFLIYKEYDVILKKYFGDYMQLPPPEERQFYHTTLKKSNKEA